MSTQSLARQHGLGKICGCPETEWSKCRTRGDKHGWYFLPMINGDRSRPSIEMYLRLRGRTDDCATVTDAAKIAAEIRSAKMAGTFTMKPAKPTPAPAPAPTTGGTVEGLGKSFKLTIDAKSIASGSEDKHRFDLLAGVDVPDVGRVGDLPIHDVTGDIVQAAYMAITKDRANSTKRKTRRVIKAFFRWAMKHRHLIESPIPTDDKTFMVAGKCHRRHRRVSRELEAGLIEAANECRRPHEAARLVAIIIAAFETGARLGELLALKWSDIDWTRRRITIRAEEVGAQKTKTPRVVLLTERMVPLLEYLNISPLGKPWDSTCYVFGDEIGDKVGTIIKGWTTAVLRAHNIEPKWTAKGGLSAATQAAMGRVDLHFHDIRHEAAWRWHEAGVPLAKIAKALGHSSVAELETYLGIDTEAALETIAAVQGPAAPTTIRGRDGKLVTVEAAQPTGNVTNPLPNETESGVVQNSGKSDNLQVH